MDFFQNIYINPIDIKMLFYEKSYNNMDEEIEVYKNIKERLISDNKKIVSVSKEFLKKYTKNYLYHIADYNNQVVNIEIPYDESTDFIFPDKCEIKSYDDFLKKFYKLKNKCYKYIGMNSVTLENVNRWEKILQEMTTVLVTDVSYSTIMYFKDNDLSISISFEELVMNDDTNESHSQKKQLFVFERFLKTKDIINYYDFFENLVNEEIKLENQYDNPSIILNYYVFTQQMNDLILLYFYNGLMIQLYTLFKAITSRFIDKEKEDVADMLINRNVYTLGVEYFNPNSFSIEDEDVEKLVDQAQNAKKQSENEKKEADKENKDEGTTASTLNKIKEKISKTPLQAKTFVNKTRMFLQNRKSVWLYKRVLGKIDGLYEFYAGDAIIDESKFKDDPVTILKDKLAPDIIRIGKEVAKLCDEVEKFSKQAAAMESYEAVIELGKKWCKNLPDLTKAGEKMDDLSITKKIEYATRTRLVEILTKNNDKIYGFTKESMIVKKLPPPNHFVISYILINPQEKPIDQSVSEIFKSADSFRIMANAEKNDVFQIHELMQAVLNNKMDAETFERIEARRKVANERIRENNAKHGKDEIDEEVQKEYRATMEGIKKSVETMAKQKIYVGEIINLFGNLVMRIDKLCIRCIRTMLAVEAEKSDDRYRNKLGAGKGIMATSQTAAVANGEKKIY